MFFASLVGFEPTTLGPRRPMLYQLSYKEKYSNPIPPQSCVTLGGSSPLREDFTDLSRLPTSVYLFELECFFDPDKEACVSSKLWVYQSLLRMVSMSASARCCSTKNYQDFQRTFLMCQGMDLNHRLPLGILLP